MPATGHGHGQTPNAPLAPGRAPGCLPEGSVTPAPFECRLGPNLAYGRRGARVELCDPGARPPTTRSGLPPPPAPRAGRRPEANRGPVAEMPRCTRSRETADDQVRLSRRGRSPGRPPQRRSRSRSVDGQPLRRVVERSGPSPLSAPRASDDPTGRIRRPSRGDGLRLLLDAPPAFCFENLGLQAPSTSRGASPSRSMTPLGIGAQELGGGGRRRSAWVVQVVEPGRCPCSSRWRRGGPAATDDSPRILITPHLPRVVDVGWADARAPLGVVPPPLDHPHRSRRTSHRKEGPIAPRAVAWSVGGLRRRGRRSSEEHPPVDLLFDAGASVSAPHGLRGAGKSKAQPARARRGTPSGGGVLPQPVAEGPQWIMLGGGVGCGSTPTRCDGSTRASARLAQPGSRRRSTRPRWRIIAPAREAPACSSTEKTAGPGWRIGSPRVARSGRRPPDRRLVWLRTTLPLLALLEDGPTLPAVPADDELERCPPR